MPCEIAATVRLPTRTQRYRNLVNKVLRSLKYDVRTTEVSIAFISDAPMRKLNAQYRKKHSTTDVLSFPGGSNNELGEVVISVPQARRQSRRFGTTLTDELSLLVVHGVLHLAGYDHEMPRARSSMQVLEQRLLKGHSLIHRTTISL